MGIENINEEVNASLFDELHALRERVEELERQLATIASSVQGHAEALKIILTAAKMMQKEKNA